MNKSLQKQNHTFMTNKIIYVFTLCHLVGLSMITMMWLKINRPKIQTIYVDNRLTVTYIITTYLYICIICYLFSFCILNIRELSDK